MLDVVGAELLLVGAGSGNETGALSAIIYFVVPPSCG